MATHVHDLTGLLCPDPTSTTPPYDQPSTILDVNKLHDAIPHLIFPDGSTKCIASGKFRMPENYVGTPVWIVRWKTAAITGSAVWDVDANMIAAGESADPAAFTESLTATDAAAGTTELANDATLAATAGNFAAGDTVYFSVARDLVDAADTLADEAELIGFYFSYADV